MRVFEFVILGELMKSFLVLNAIPVHTIILSNCKPLFKVFETLINFSHLSFFAHKGEGNSFKFLYADQDKESICNISNIDSDF